MKRFTAQLQDLVSYCADKFKNIWVSSVLNFIHEQEEVADRADQQTLHTID
ncbi:MAG: hypothetical protein ACPGUT_15385 [Halocynthiibacter sp.]